MTRQRPQPGAARSRRPRPDVARPRPEAAAQAPSEAPIAAQPSDAAAGEHAVVVMAQVLVPYGVQGWIKLRPYSSVPDALLGYKRWWLRGQGSDAWREVERLDAKMHAGTVLAQLAGCESREAAMALRGAEVGVLRDALPALREGEMYWTDLVGLEVVNREGAVLGRVASVQEYGAHPVLRVAALRQGEAGAATPERLIPFVAAHVDRVDVPAGRIEVDWQPDY